MIEHAGEPCSGTVQKMIDNATSKGRQFVVLMIKQGGRSCRKADPDHARERLSRWQARTAAVVLEGAGGTETSPAREVGASETAFGRKRKKAVGRQRGAGVGTGRSEGGGRGAGDEHQDDSGREEGTAEETQPGGGWGGGRAGASARGWAEIPSRERSGIAPGHRADRGPGHAGGPDGSSEMDIQKLKSHRQRAELRRLLRPYHHGEQGVAGEAGV